MNQLGFLSLNLYCPIVGLLLLAGWRKDEYWIKIILGKILQQNFLVERPFACIMTPMLYVAEHTQKMLSFTT